MNKFLIAVLLNVIFFSSCVSTKTFSEINGTINYELVNEISIAIHRNGQHSTKLISDKDSIKYFVTDLNESRIDGPWKGANWDKILIIYRDTTIKLNTNGKVFGINSSGQFFKLNKKYLNEWNFSNK